MWTFVSILVIFQHLSHPPVRTVHLGCRVGATLNYRKIKNKKNSQRQMPRIGSGSEWRRKSKNKRLLPSQHTICSILYIICWVYFRWVEPQRTPLMHNELCWTTLIWSKTAWKVSQQWLYPSDHRVLFHP